MSLTSFVAMSDVAARLKPLRPKGSRKIGAKLVAEPRSKRYGLVGTAFDYLLRFELQRRAPHAVVEPWVAEGASDRLAIFAPEDLDDCLPPDEAGIRASTVVENAKVAVGVYLKADFPEPAQLANLAAHAIRLAKLDEFYRSWRLLDSNFEEVAAEDVEDLLSMLQIVPFESLIDTRVLLLNPTFEAASRLVGGADADLIAGDLLADFKVTKTAEMNAKDLDQLLGYFLLTRKQRCVDRTYPDIRRVGIYFGRHGYLWVLRVSTWTEQPEFRELEDWFFIRAQEVFGATK